MSQMPDKIWLHKNTKYNTGDIVCGYQYDFVQGIEDKGGIENFVEYVPADAFIEKAMKWIELSLKYYSEGGKLISRDKMVKDFREYMEGE